MYENSCLSTSWNPILFIQYLTTYLFRLSFLFLSARVRVFSPILYVLNTRGTGLQTQASWECLRITLAEFLMQSNPSTQKVSPGPGYWPSILTQLLMLGVSWVPGHTWALFSLELTFSPDLPHLMDVKAVCPNHKVQGSLWKTAFSFSPIPLQPSTCQHLHPSCLVKYSCTHRRLDPGSQPPTHDYFCRSSTSSALHSCCPLADLQAVWKPQPAFSRTSLSIFPSLQVWQNIQLGRLSSPCLSSNYMISARKIAQL